METKAMTLRLDADQADALAKVAEVDGVTVTEAMRTAIDEHIAVRAADPAFRARLTASIARNKRVLDRLANS